MNNITIGITGRDEIIGKDLYQIVSKNILKNIYNKASYIGLVNYEKNYIDESILNMCDAIIIEGGKEIHNYHYQIVDYCIKNKIPLLGICMGHQIIGLFSAQNEEKDLIEVKGHNEENKYHEIKISKDSILERLYGDKLLVNTRHNYALKDVCSPFKIVAKSNDGVIEAIENTSDGNYILAMQWHPEDMNNMEKIFIDFIREALIRKNKL